MQEGGRALGGHLEIAGGAPEVVLGGEATGATPFCPPYNRHGICSCRRFTPKDGTASLKVLAGVGIPGAAQTQQGQRGGCRLRPAGTQAGNVTKVSAEVRALSPVSCPQAGSGKRASASAGSADVLLERLSSS